MSPKTLKGADVIVWLGGKKYTKCQSINYTIDYQYEPIYGIDSAFAQEMAPIRLSITGTITGIETRASSGLQGSGIRPLLSQYISCPYIQLRIQDRQTKDDILIVNNIIVTSESGTYTAKDVASFTFSFKGIQPTFPLDMD
jgi:hypothetical protein